MVFGEEFVRKTSDAGADEASYSDPALPSWVVNVLAASLSLSRQGLFTYRWFDAGTLEGGTIPFIRA